MHNEHRKSSLFLLEILLNILLFCILSVSSLQFFMKALQLTEQTTTLQEAVFACNNVSAIYKNNDGSLDSLLDAYPYAIRTNRQVLIFFDKEYQECTHESAEYYILIETTNEDSIRIDYYKDDDDVRYSLTAYRHTPLTPADLSPVAYTNYRTQMKEDDSND